MTKFSCAFLLLATVVADLAKDLLDLMGSKAAEIQAVLEKEKDAIVEDDFKPLFAAGGDASQELKEAGAKKADEDGAINYAEMVKSFQGFREDPTTIDEANVKTLIKTVQDAAAEDATTPTDMVTKLKEISDLAVKAIEAAAAAGGASSSPSTNAPSTSTTTAIDGTAESTTAASVENGDGDEDGDEDDEEETTDAQSASFNFALSSALLSIVV